MKKGEKKIDFTQVIEAIKGLREEFDKKLGELDKKIDKKAEKEMISVDLTGSTTTSSMPIAKETVQTSEFPVPKEYLEARDTILNNRFGIKIIPQTNSPSFVFQILVPKEYSNAGENTWKDAKADIRSKVITYGEGLLGVKTYIELVKSNLGPEINAKIQKDKE